jgi:hypothetical protein
MFCDAVTQGVAAVMLDQVEGVQHRLMASATPST